MDCLASMQTRLSDMLLSIPAGRVSGFWKEGPHGLNQGDCSSAVRGDSAGTSQTAELAGGGRCSGRDLRLAEGELDNLLSQRLPSLYHNLVHHSPDTKLCAASSLRAMTKVSSIIVAPGSVRDKIQHLS